MQSTDYVAMKVVSALPRGSQYLEGGENVVRHLIGATIIQIGSPDEDGIEGGGLIVDYRPLGESTTRRVVFGFNEIALWVEYDGYLPIEASSQE